MTVEPITYGGLGILLGVGATIGAAFRSWGRLQTAVEEQGEKLEKLEGRVDAKADRDGVEKALDRLERAITGLTVRLDRWMERQK